MADAVHTSDDAFVGVVEDYRKNYAGEGRKPRTGDDSDGMIERVKDLETYREIGVPWLGYSYSKEHPTTAKTAVDERVEIDQAVIAAAMVTAQNILD